MNNLELLTTKWNIFKMKKQNKLKLQLSFQRLGQVWKRELFLNEKGIVLFDQTNLQKNDFNIKDIIILGGCGGGL